jgi:hypothetical protein
MSQQTCTSGSFPLPDFVEFYERTPGLRVLERVPTRESIGQLTAIRSRVAIRLGMHESRIGVRLAD